MASEKMKDTVKWLLQWMALCIVAGVIGAFTKWMDRVDQYTVALVVGFLVAKVSEWLDEESDS